MNEAREFAVWTLKVLDAAAEHRTQAIQRGFSMDAAEAMAVTLHSVLMASIYEEAEGEDLGVDSPPEE